MRVTLQLTIFLVLCVQVSAQYYPGYPGDGASGASPGSACTSSSECWNNNTCLGGRCCNFGSRASASSLCSGYPLLAPSHRRTLKPTPCLVRSSPSCARFFTNLLHPPGALSFAPHFRLPRSRHQMSTSAPTTCTAPARDVPPGVRGTRDARRVATRAIRTRSGSTQTRGSAPAAPLGIDC